MKIVKFSAENVKKLKVVEITPQGHVIQITGANGEGKTSVLDAIYYALAGTTDIPSKPVRLGTEKAVVKLDLGELVVTRRFSEAGGTSLTVEATNGARFPSPQRMLDDLVGSFSFDPLAFARLDARGQLYALRRLVPLEIDVDELDARNERDFSNRTDLNRRAKALEAQIAAFVVREGTPDEPVDVMAIVEELEAAGKHNANVETARGERVTSANRAENETETADRARIEAVDVIAREERETLNAVARAEREAAELEKRAAQIRADAEAAGKESYEAARKKAIELEKKAKGHEANAARYSAEAAMPIDSLIDTVALKAKVETARETNDGVEAKKRKEAKKRELAAITSDAEELTKTMRTRLDAKTAAIEKAAMPVPGLAFGEGRIEFGGIPFDQASDADRLRVSVAIAMAANTKLRVLRIRDGSLLDEKSLALVAAMAEEKDFQVWIEQVDTSGKVGIYMEDGSVKAVNA